MATEEEFQVESLHFKRLLLAVDDDDDESSRRAFNYACTLAKVYGIPLGIVSVLETGDMNIFQSLSPDVLAQRRAEITHHLDTYVDKATQFGWRTPNRLWLRVSRVGSSSKRWHRHLSPTSSLWARTSGPTTAWAAFRRL